MLCMSIYVSNTSCMVEKNIEWLNPFDTNNVLVYEYLLQGHQAIKWMNITWLLEYCLERNFISTTCKSYLDVLF